ncbi:uncharacterized protein V6R79_023146 [Siganus canaliculatus]
MPAPATEDWRGVAEGFRDRWAFPNCVRSIDEKHVVFKAPDNSGSLLYNYKWCHPDSDSGPPCGDVVRGFTIDESCRKRWKGLRDTYLKERRKKAEESRSGSAAGTGRGWKHSAVVSFLDPFVSPRETSSNMLRGVEEDLTAEYFHPSEAGPSEIRDTNYEWAEGESGEGGEGETEEERDTAAEERPGERAGARAGEDAGAFSAAKPPALQGRMAPDVGAERDLLSVHEKFPELVVVWSDISQRRWWASASKKARKWVNSVTNTFVQDLSGLLVVNIRGRGNHWRQKLHEHSNVSEHGCCHTHNG